MERLFSKDTVHGIIGNQIYKRTRMYASREQVISLMGRATMGRDVLTVFFQRPCGITCCRFTDLLYAATHGGKEDTNIKWPREI